MIDLDMNQSLAENLIEWTETAHGYQTMAPNVGREMADVILALIKEMRAARAIVEALRLVYLSDDPGDEEHRLAGKLSAMIAAYDDAIVGKS